MKQKIKILNGDTVVYKGRIADIPITKDAIIQKSIELFDDEDPCIIHQSYVVKEYVDQILTLFKTENVSTLELSNHSEQLSFLDIDDLEHCTIVLEG